MANGKLLYESIMETLTGEVASGTLSAGERLPSVEALRGRFDVSHITILRVLRELNEAGVVERHGRGYRVSSTSAQHAETPELPVATRPVGLFLRPVREHGYDNYFNEINLAVESELALARKNHLRSFAANSFNHQVEFSSDDCDEMLRQLQAMIPQCCGLLLDERIPDSVLQQLADNCPIPAIIVNRHTELERPSVAIDARESAELLLEKAKQLGYTQLILCGNAKMRYSNDAKRYLQCIELAKSDGRFQSLHLHLHSNDQYSEPLSLTIIEQQFNKVSRYGKTLILSWNDRIGIACVERLETSGLRAGNDFGVCGFYNYALTLPDGRKLSTIRIDTDALGRMAVRMLLTRLNSSWGIGVERKSCPLDFIFGETM